MDIKNLNQPGPVDTTTTPSMEKNSQPIVTSKAKKITVYHLMMAILGIFTAFWLSRFFPSSQSSTLPLSQDSDNQDIVSSEQISSQEDIKVGQTYGNLNGTFKDTATGYVRQGNINGVGTHILERDGGLSQRASLTSSVLDLDLFVDRKVEIKGETNSSDKTSWLLDVGSIKVLE